MTERSVVYKDSDGYTILVAHGKNNPLKRLGVKLTGLIHYYIDADSGIFQFFDGANYVFYPLDAWWEGIDMEAYTQLSDSYQRKHGAKLDEQYFSTIELYASAVENDLVREALA